MLFNMLILGSLVDESGYVFHRSENDLFIVETTLPTDKNEVGYFFLTNFDIYGNAMTNTQLRLI